MSPPRRSRHPPGSPFPLTTTAPPLAPFSSEASFESYSTSSLDSSLLTSPHPKLWKAISKGNLKKVLRELSLPGSDLSVSYRDVTHLRTPLYHAASLGFAEITRALLADKRIDPNLPRRRGETALFVAAQKGYDHVVELLLGDPRVMVNVGNAEGATAVYVASESGHGEIVRRLLRVGHVNPGMTTHELVSPLYIACQNGHLGVVRDLLLHPKVLVNAETAERATPLHVACDRGSRLLVQALLQQGGIQVNKRNQDGATPFLLACQEGRGDVVDLMLKDARVDVHKGMVGGISPFWAACRGGNTEVVKILMEDGRVEINTPDENCHASPLWIACEGGHAGVVKALLDRPELLVEMADVHGVVPLMVALHHGHTEVVKVLLASRHLFSVGGILDNPKLAIRPETRPAFFLIASYHLYPDAVKKMILVEDGEEPKETKELRESLERERRLVDQLEERDRVNSELQTQVLGLLSLHQPGCFPGGIQFRMQDILEATNNFDHSASSGETVWSVVFPCLLSKVPVEVHMLKPDNSILINSASLQRAWHLLEAEPALQKVEALVGHSELTSNLVCLVYRQPRAGSVLQALSSPNPPSWSQRVTTALMLSVLGGELQALNGKGRLPGSFLPSLDTTYLDPDSQEVTFAGFELLMSTLENLHKIEQKDPELRESAICSPRLIASLGVAMATLLTGKLDKNLVNTVLEAMPRKASLFPRESLDPALRGRCAQDGYRTLGQIMRGCLDPSISKRPALKEVVAQLELLSNDDHRVCVVCMENPPNVILTCNHFVVCSPCARSLVTHHRPCPICRAELMGYKERLPKSPSKAKQEHLK